eukprot:SAG25_NODE_1032_length_4223_cov_96.274006_1_plen_220_part_00
MLLVRRFSDGASSRPQVTFHGGKPTVEDARSQPRSACEMPHDVLLNLAAHGDSDAREERMVREIMAVDGVEWSVAKMTLEELRDANQDIMKTSHVLAASYYKFAAASAVVVGFASFPMCFDLTTVMWFNKIAVTTEVPPPDDLETIFEVGMWSWGWMEPPLGQLSFLLLCIQFAREQMDKLALPTTHERLITRRAVELSHKYGRFYPKIVQDFSSTQPF